MTDSVLITGGLGYLGGRVSRFLEEHSWKLRLTTRDASQGRPSFLEHAEIVPLDLVPGDNLGEICQGVRVVIHLAGQNAIEAAANPQDAVLVNALGTLKLLEAAKQAGAQRFIYFSTGHVYGAPLEGTITEQTIARPVHPYSITHRSAEDFVLAAHLTGGIQGIVLRLSNGFGAPARVETNCWMLIVTDLCKQAVTTKRLVLRTHGCQRRDFVTMSDVGRAVLHVMTLATSEFDDGLFNLGGEFSVRIIDIAERIADRCQKVLGFYPPIDRPAPPPGLTSPSLDYRIDKLKSTGFVLRGNVDEEIDATLELCREAFGK